MQSVAEGSTPAAETTATNECMKRSAYPLLSFFEELLDRPVHWTHEMDAEASRLAIAGRKSHGLEYMKKHSGVSMAFLRDAFDPEIHDERTLAHVPTDLNESDIFTKAMKTGLVFHGHRETLGFRNVADFERFTIQVPELPQYDDRRGILKAVSGAAAFAATMGTRVLEDESARGMLMRWAIRRVTRQ
jgi:hypothetical protein